MVTPLSRFLHLALPILSFPVPRALAQALPLNATNGFVEQFTADLHCVAGTSVFPGFDRSVGSVCSLPGFLHPSTPGLPFDQVRVLAYGVTNAQPPSPNHWALGFTDVFAGDSGNAFAEGMSNCNPGQWSCGSANEVAAVLDAGGFGYRAGAGTPRTLWNQGGNNAAVTGSTDSGFGGGWAAPKPGNLYHVTLRSPGDGTLIESIFPDGDHLCIPGACGAIFRVPFSYPAGSIHQFFARGSGGADFVGNVSEADGVNLHGQPPAYDMPPAGSTGGLEGMRWALHRDGTEWDYRTPATDLMTVWEWDAAMRSQEAPRPWVVLFRGIENTIVAAYTDYEMNAGNQTLSTLLQAGFVVVALDFHTLRAYGGPQEMSDVAMALAKVQSSMNLQPRPFAMADSAGGINLLNAVSHGVFLPKAILCFSCNLSLASDAYGQGGMDRQMSYIQEDYGFADPTRYLAITSGYDPLLVVQHPETSAPAEPGSHSLARDAARRIAGVPMQFYADPTDPIVNSALNSVAMCSAVNAITAGDCRLDLSRGGGHVGGQEFPNTEILNFLLAHQ